MGLSLVVATGPLSHCGLRASTAVVSVLGVLACCCEAWTKLHCSTWVLWTKDQTLNWQVGSSPLRFQGKTPVTGLSVRFCSVLCFCASAICTLLIATAFSKVREPDSSTFVSLSQDHFSYYWCFVFPHRFQNFLFWFCERCHW